jgi:two-component system, LytTR family, response regulator
MTLKTIIVDDEFHAVENLRLLVAKHCPHLHIVAVAHNITEARAAIVQHQPDLVFLDIKMPGGDGMQLLQNRGDHPFMVIFVTAFDEFAIRALKAGAIDYILKPVDYRELTEAGQRALQLHQSTRQSATYTATLEYTLSRIDKKEPANRLGIVNGNDYVLLPTSDIVALLAEGAYTRIVAASGKEYMASRNLGFYEEILDETSFFRIHKSSIVNMGHVQKLDKASRTVIMSNTLKLLVSFRIMPGFVTKLRKGIS